MQPHRKENDLTEDLWSKEFPITSVTRADLISAGFPQSVVESLADEDMQQIASAMEDVYCDHGYWEDLELCTKRILERRGLESEIEENDDG